MSFIQGFLLNLIISFSTNSSLVGPCSLASLFHAQPPCFDRSSYRSSFNRSSIFSGLSRRGYAKQAKLRHYPLANPRFCALSSRTTFILILLLVCEHRKTDNAHILDMNVFINWQLLKQGNRWPVSLDRIAGSGVDPSRSSIFLKLSADK